MDPLKSARQAVDRAPNNIEFAEVYAHLLYIVAKTSKKPIDYEEVEEVCERALSMKEPIVEEDSQLKKGRTKEERIAVARQNLKAFWNKSRDASISAQLEKFQSQLSDSVKPENEGANAHVGNYFHEPGQRLRQTALTKIESRVTGIAKLVEFWKSMPVEKKRPLLKFRISDLMKHFSSLKEKTAVKMLPEAINFASEYKTWRFWHCCFCGEKFIDSELHKKHLMETHDAYFPVINSPRDQVDKIDKFWVDMLVNGTWKPIDTVKAAQIIRECQLDYVQTEWPLSDDNKRSEILQKIHGKFQEVLRQDWLTKGLLKALVDYTMYELQHIIPIGMFFHQALDQTHLCFCLLGVSQLQQLYQYLELLSSPLSSNFNAVQNLVDGLDNYHVSDIKERVVISEDLSYLFLDHRLLTGELTIEGYGQVVTHDTCAATGTISYDGINIPPDSHSLVGWLLTVSSVGEQLRLWNNAIDESKRVVKRVLEVFVAVRKLMDGFFVEKAEVMKHGTLLRAIASVYDEKLEKMEPDAVDTSQTFTSLVRKELERIDNGDISENTTLVVGMFTSMVKEAQTLNVNQAGTSSGSRDYESSKQGCQVGVQFRNLLQRRLIESSLQIGHLISRIERLQNLVGQVDVKVQRMSYFDYRHVLLPLLKSFLRDHLQAQLENDARKEADAAALALLAELAKECGKNVAKGGSLTGSQQQKSKAKKKTKTRRKQNTKKQDASSNKLDVQEEEPHEQIDDLNAGISAAANADELNPEEEELKLKEYLEAQERMLAEKLNFQLLLEEEAKAKAEAKLAQGTEDNKVPDNSSPPPQPPPPQKSRGRKHRRKQNNKKDASSSKLDVQEEEPYEQIDDSKSGIDAAANADELNPKEEKLKLKEYLEAQDRMLEEKLNLQQRVEKEAKAQAGAKLEQATRDDKMPDNSSPPPLPPSLPQRGNKFDVQEEGPYEQIDDQSSGFGLAANADELNPEEEELKVKENLEPQERMPEEELNFHQRAEEEAKAKVEAKLKQATKDDKMPDNSSLPVLPPPCNKFDVQEEGPYEQIDDQRSGIGVAANADELNPGEEELKVKEDLEPQERMPEEELNFHQWAEEEAKIKAKAKVEAKLEQATRDDKMPDNSSPPPPPPPPPPPRPGNKFGVQGPYEQIDDKSSGIGVAANADELNPEEEELRLKEDLQAQERMLEEKLNFQQQADEAKAKAEARLEQATKDNKEPDNLSPPAPSPPPSPPQRSRSRRCRSLSW